MVCFNYTVQPSDIDLYRHFTTPRYPFLLQNALFASLNGIRPSNLSFGTFHLELKGQLRGGNALQIETSEDEGHFTQNIIYDGRIRTTAVWTPDHRITLSLNNALANHRYQREIDVSQSIFQDFQEPSMPELGIYLLTGMHHHHLYFRLLPDGLPSGIGLFATEVSWDKLREVGPGRYTVESVVHYVGGKK